MAESEELSNSEEESQHFRRCLQGFAYAENVLRQCCKEKVENIQNKLQESLKKRECQGNITKISPRSCTDLKSRKIKWSPECTHKPGCYTYLQQIERKLSAATMLNPNTLFMNIDIEHCKDDALELANLFVEPWMRKCRFEDFDTYCLLVLLGNVDAVHENDLPPKEKPYVRTLRREQIQKTKDIAESCLLAESIQMTNEETNICLQVIINLLAFAHGNDADEAIQSISQIKDSEHTNMGQADHIWTRRNKLKKVKGEFEEKVRDFASAIPHEVGNADTTQSGLANIKKIPQTTKDECLQAILFSLEKAERVSASELMDHLLKLHNDKDQLVSLPASEYEHMIAVLKTVKGTQPLQEMVLNEASVRNSKVCRLVFFTIEDVLRSFCRDQINGIHRKVKTKFGREKLCDSADEKDICQTSAFAPEEIKFKHDCTLNPKCSEFLQSVVSACSAEGQLTVCRMFSLINPQDCLIREWDFTRLFMEPSMLRLREIEQLNAYCLLSLMANVQMLDVPEIEKNAISRKVRQVRDVACKILIHNETVITTEVKNQCVQHIIDILDSMDTATVPTNEKTILQIKYLTSEMLPVFDIKQGNKSRENVVAAYFKQNIVSNRDYNNWCKSALALKYLMTALVPFLVKEIQIIFDDVVTQFHRASLCPEAKLDDFKCSRQKGAKFGHHCSGSPLHCNTILALIKNETHSDHDFIYMVKGTDPQLWLHSPLEFAKLFLKEWSRPGIREFEDFDISAFCSLVKRGKKLKQKVDENLLNQLRDARNRFMHNAKLSMSQQDLEEHLDTILYFLKNQDFLNGKEETKQAIEDIGQLRNAEKILLHEEAIHVIKEVVWPVIKKKRIYESTMYTEVFKSLNVPFGNRNAERGTIEEEQRRRIEEEKERQRQEEEERQRQEEEERQRQEEEELQRQLEEERQRQLEEERQRQEEEERQRQEEEERQRQLQFEPIRRRIVGAIWGGMMGAIAGPAGVLIGAAVGAAFPNGINHRR